jgi:hypothetical protein
VHLTQQSPPGTNICALAVLLLTASGEQMGAAAAAVDASFMIVLSRCC